MIGFERIIPYACDGELIGVLYLLNIKLLPNNFLTFQKLSKLERTIYITRYSSLRPRIREEMKEAIKTYAFHIKKILKQFLGRELPSFYKDSVI